MTEVIELIVIRNEQDYRAALARLDEIIDADPDSNDGYELKVLAKVIADYEEATDEPPPVQADAVDVLKFFMEQHDLRQADLVPYIGSKSVVSQILSRKRSLTLAMVRKLSAGLHIPAGALL